MFVTRCSIAANANSQNSRSASFALGLEHSIQNHFATAVQIAVRLELFVWQRILRPHVFATASLQDQPHMDFRRAVLMKMQRWRPRPKIRPVISAIDRID